MEVLLSQAKGQGHLPALTFIINPDEKSAKNERDLIGAELTLLNTDQIYR